MTVVRRMQDQLHRRYAGTGLESQRKALVFAIFLALSIAIMIVACAIFLPLRPMQTASGMLPVLLVLVIAFLLVTIGRLNAAVTLVGVFVAVLVFARTIWWEQTPSLFLSKSMAEYVFRLVFPLLVVTFFSTKQRYFFALVLLCLASMLLFYGLQADRLRMTPYELSWALGMYAILIVMGWVVAHLNRGVITTLAQRTTGLQSSHDALMLSHDQLEARNEELRRARDELQRYRDHLEELVLNRTRALNEAQEELVRKDRLATVGQLAATVNHELRNPLGALSNAVFLLRQVDGETQNPRRLRALDIAERNIARCTRIVGEFLEFSRRPKPQLESVDIDPWLARLLDEQEIPEGITLLRSLASGVSVNIDRELLRRAVINAVSNALQAVSEPPSAPTNGCVQVKTEKEPGRLTIKIIDNGPGISPQDLEKVFEPLYSTKTFGVGLGLPIVRNAMTELGGSVDLVSDVGRATTITLALPLARPPAPDLES